MHLLVKKFEHKHLKNIRKEKSKTSFSFLMDKNKIKYKHRKLTHQDTEVKHSHNPMTQHQPELDSSYHTTGRPNYWWRE